MGRKLIELWFQPRILLIDHFASERLPRRKKLPWPRGLHSLERVDAETRKQARPGWTHPGGEAIRRY